MRVNMWLGGEWWETDDEQGWCVSINNLTGKSNDRIYCSPSWCCSFLVFLSMFFRNWALALSFLLQQTTPNIALMSNANFFFSFFCSQIIMMEPSDNGRLWKIMTEWIGSLIQWEAWRGVERWIQKVKGWSNGFDALSGKWWQEVQCSDSQLGFFELSPDLKREVQNANADSFSLPNIFLN